MLPLGGCDVVFGTQWLSTLGVINWDFMNLSMEFKYGDQQVMLQGLNTLKGFEVQDDVQFFKESTRKGLILHIIADSIAEKQPALPLEITALL